MSSLKGWTSWQTISVYLPVCVSPHFFMCPWVCGGQHVIAVLLWFSDMSRLPYSSSRWWLMMFAEIQQAQTWSIAGPPRRNPTEPELSLPWLAWLRKVVKWTAKAGVWKAMFNSSHWGFHTFVSGHWDLYFYGNWALLTFWPNGWLSITSNDITWHCIWCFHPKRLEINAFNHDCKNLS